MEQAPPVPTKASPKLYMTPQVAKRRDGLCPSLFDLGLDLSQAAKRNPGGLNKTYRTTSDLLLQIKDRDGSKKEEIEAVILVQSITEGIKEMVGPDADIVGFQFRPEGCEWILQLNSTLNDADKNYELEVVLFANAVQGVTHYVADTLLVTKGQRDPNPLAPPLKGYREAKQVFEHLALKVRKSVVRHEFPDFPEGCKGRPFREVYQLNARVSLCGGLVAGC